MSAITVAEFKALPKESRSRYRDPFYYAFEHGVMTMSKDKCVGVTDDLALMCDDSDDAVKCLQAFQRLKKREPSVDAKVAVIAFGDDKRYPPLQAADMIAFCHRASKTSAERGLWSAPLEIILATFSETRSHEDITVNDKEVS